MSCSVKTCPNPAERTIGGTVALMLGVAFYLNMDDALRLHLCRQHYNEALLVTNVVVPPLLDRRALDPIE